MLTSLRIENFTIVSNLELDFHHGMTAFTGETGAGKSIMIDALMLALGERADASVLRPGAEKCDISACFHIDRFSLPETWLQEHDVACEDNLIFLRRVIYSEGRSKSYINGHPFPLQKIKELSSMLVDIHGQHQHQTLLQHPTHRLQLDQFAGHDELLQKVQFLYQGCLNVKQKIQRLQNQNASLERRDLLTYQLEELASLNLQEGELKNLHEEHQLLHHARDYLDYAQQVTLRLQGDESPTICQNLSQILHYLSALPQEHALIKNAGELINSALIQCEEAADEIARFADCIQLDPERLHAVEERMSLLHQIARKFHVDPEQLSEHAQQLQQELDNLQATEQELKDLEQQHQQQLMAYEQAALLLRVSRQQHAEKLAQEISATIRQLGMPKGYITIEISPLDKMTAHGMDKVEYKVCTNPGMLPDTLGKIASGGELSRISLAIQMITAQRASTPTLLFDEVDVGIGGATAALVGQLLRKLGERLQIFCVTHQPQVAACAHQHFVVEKHSDDTQTYSRIIPLNDDEKVDEIARMLGGLTITEQTRSHARELLFS
ncbi:DNA repair protein RecN [Legionella septentrionalis]|uniref:DNA repair protein RecN n=1 Tax=Legionella septentrionalis TaxID=2498109 RepID=UPI000F8E9F43|nr:DNA repair protein RecN [Legionella septentrionalis]RUQ97080.1 DNA repair protein RecN [Legionella septentrionalis]